MPFDLLLYAGSKILVGALTGKFAPAWKSAFAIGSCSSLTMSAANRLMFFSVSSQMNAQTHLGISEYSAQYSPFPPSGAVIL